MLQKSYFLTILFMMFLTAFAQSQVNQELTSYNVRIVKDYRLDVLLERFNKTDKIKGFRIQIHSGLRKEAARKSKSQFLLLFPEFSSYESYQQPYFNVKVGDFLTKLEAQCFLNTLRTHFPNSFIVPDYIVPLNLNVQR